MPLSARVFAVAVAVGGCVIAAWRVAAGSFDLGAPEVLVVLVAVWIAVAVHPSGLPVGREVRDIDLQEAVLAAAAFLLPSPGLIALMLPGEIAQNLSRSRAPLKAAFNLGNSLGAVAIGSMVIDAIGSPVRHGISGRSVTAVVLGACAMTSLAHLSVHTVVALASGPRRASSRAEDLPIDMGVAACTISLGVLAGVAAADHSWIGLFALPVVASLAVVLRQLVSAVRDHARLEGLLSAAQRVHATLSRSEVEAAAAAAAGDLLESTARIQTDPPDDATLAARLRPTGAWLVVDERHRLFPFTRADERMLDAVAALATAALDNVALVDQVRHQAVHDLLTGLPNAVLLEDRARQALHVASQSQQEVVVAAVDIDRFALVNDAFGPSVGDRILREAGHRLVAALGPGDTVSRRGNDEFTLLLAGGQPVDAAIETAFARPFHVGEQALQLTVSAGWASYPRDASDVIGLIRAANVALWQAKQADGDRIVEYHGDIEVSSAEGLAMESDLHRAIDRGELWVAFQPQLEFSSGRIVAFEALVRWRHPVMGAVAPDRFLRLAERSDLIARIDLWVLEQSLRQLRLWEQQGFAGLRVAVNFSPRVLRVPGVVDRVVETARSCGVSLARLDVEITEKVAAAEANEAMEVVDGLRNRGVTISMDDFGTGYSALARLRDLPIDTIKIDQSFVRAIGERRDEEPILLAAIQMGHQLGLRVVAEGVETAEQLAFLEAAACDGAQGYLLARPMSGVDAGRWLVARLLASTGTNVGSRVAGSIVAHGAPMDGQR